MLVSMATYDTNMSAHTTLHTAVEGPDPLLSDI